MSLSEGLIFADRPHIVRRDGKWHYYAVVWQEEARKNAAAAVWCSTRNYTAKLREQRRRLKPNRCPVPQDDVCDYGRAITLNDDPGRNPHGPFN